MTIQELYARIGGNYDQAVRVMRMDKLIDRYIRKLPDSGAYEALVTAGEAMDGTKLFESAHALKGVCANLGLDEIAALAGDITEDFRPGTARKLTDDEIKGKIARITSLYQRTLEGLRAYTA